MTKRILSVLLALVLVLAMSVSAMADAVVEYTTATLTIHDEVDGRIYTAYQIFKGNRTTNDDGDTILINVDWGKDIDKDGLMNELKVNSAEEAVKKLSNMGGKAIAELLKPYITGAGQAMPATADGSTSMTLTSGYYFVEETTTGVDTTSAFILQIVDDQEVDTKRSDVPVTDKVIVDGTQATATDAQVGESVKFQVSAKVPDNYDDYNTYKLVFNDTMTNGLKFNDDIEVTVDGDVTLPQATASLTTSTETSFTYGWENLAGTANLAGKTITLTYTAKVTDAALVQKENSFTLTYTNGPDSEAETTPKKVYVYTFKVDGAKVDEASKPLADATFVLKNIAGKYYKLENGVVSWVDSETDATPYTTSTDNNCTVAFTGLDVGTYYLKETAAPKGYNMLVDEIEVNITADYSDDGATVTLTSTSDNVSATTAGVTTTIMNNKGTTLPSTGGMGTTIFYVVGGLLMAAAVVLLVAKKRTVNE